MMMGNTAYDKSLFKIMKLTDKSKTKLVSDYRKSKQRLILLDYDGTLTPFFETPEEAKPGDYILKLLETLAMDPGNEVVLVSGRYRGTMERWFSINMSYAADHGAWIKEKGKEWETIKPLRTDWKRDIRHVLKMYVDRTPGSFIEEKEFSIAWHYRRVDPELGTRRAKELVDNLNTGDLNLQVLEDTEIIEVKNVDINKGMAASHWIAKKEWDFVLAIGDDQTDEDVFSILPKTAYSIEVGAGPSKARFYLDSPSGVLLLLKELVED